MRLTKRHRIPLFLLVPIASGLAAGFLLSCARSSAQGLPPTDWKERDGWQHPEAIMDALGVKPGSVVADIGCGEGYFTFHLARRVGAQGKVYAEDIDRKKIRDLDMHLHKDPLPQVQTLLGKANDPHLPAESIDAILVVDAYHEMDEHAAMVQAMFRALKPGGLLGIIDRVGKPGQPRSSYHDDHHIPPELAQEEVTGSGFQLVRRETAPKPPDNSLERFFLVFQKPAAAP